MLRIIGGLEWLSGGSSWRGHLYQFTPPAGRIAACCSRQDRSRQATRIASASSPWLAHPSPGRRAGRPTVGQGLTVTAAPTSVPHSPSVSPVYWVSCPQSQLTARPTVSICAYVSSMLHFAGPRGRTPTVLDSVICDSCSYLWPAFSQCLTSSALCEG